MQIVDVASPQELASIRTLFREYQAFLGIDLEFQGFARELAALPGEYGPPQGALLLAREGREVLGCGALRPLTASGAGICEMKRLYVRPAGRGLGVGRKIAVRLIERAAALGYAAMVLDTLAHLTSAIRLYQSLGFERTEPYYDNPLPGVSYWQLELEKSGWTK